MTRGVFALAPDTAIPEAVELLRNEGVRNAPVIDPSGSPVGVVSAFDFCGPQRGVGPSGYPLFYQLETLIHELTGDSEKTRAGMVRDVMSPFVLSVSASASLEEASQRLLSEGVHRLLVMDESQFVGIVTITDLLVGFLKRTAR